MMSDYSVQPTETTDILCCLLFNLMLVFVLISVSGDA